MRRNFERRVKERPEEDPLRKFWKGLLADKDMLAAWSVKMKGRRKGSTYLDDAQM